MHLHNQPPDTTQINITLTTLDATREDIVILKTRTSLIKIAQVYKEIDKVQHPNILCPAKGCGAYCGFAIDTGTSVCVLSLCEEVLCAY